MVVKLNIANIIAKSNNRHTCLQCGSTEYIQGHHVVPRDDSTIIPLCAACHHSRHPNLPLNLFLSREHQPYWHNKSAASLAKELFLHPRTIYRKAKLLGIPKGYLSPANEALIKQSCPNREYHYAMSLGFNRYESMVLQSESIEDIDRIAKERDEAGGNGE